MAFDRNALKAQAARCVTYTGEVFTWGLVTFEAIVAPYEDQTPLDGELLGNNLERVTLRAVVADFATLPGQGDIFTANGLSYRVARPPYRVSMTGLVTFVCEVFKTTV